VQYWVKRANETVYPLPLVSKHDRTRLFRLWAVPGPFLRIIRAHARTYTRMSRLFPNRKRLGDPGNGRPDLPRAHTHYITRARARARMRRRIHAHRRAQRHGGASYGRRYPYGGDRPSQGALGRTVGTIPQTGRCGYGRSSPGEARDMRSTRVYVKKGRYRSRYAVNKGQIRFRSTRCPLMIVDGIADGCIIRGGTLGMGWDERKSPFPGCNYQTISQTSSTASEITHPTSTYA